MTALDMDDEQEAIAEHPPRTTQVHPRGLDMTVPTVGDVYEDNPNPRAVGRLFYTETLSPVPVELTAQGPRRLIGIRWPQGRGPVLMDPDMLESFIGEINLYRALPESAPLLTDPEPATVPPATDTREA